MRIVTCIVFLVLAVSGCTASWGQENKFVKDGQFYFSWGYNTERYSKSNLHIVQSGLGNDYVLNNTLAHDKIGWDRLFTCDVTVPQYNYRLGYFFNRSQTLAIELNFDHTKYVVTSGQTIHVTGTMGHQAVDMSIVAGDSVFAYQLNNGANFFLFNIVKRINLFTSASKNFQLDMLGKAGIGPLVPHVQNTIFGKDNVPHFQLGGWNTGVESTVKATFYKHFYLEFCGKFDYARYSRLRIYEGYANHSFFTREAILNIGFTLSLAKPNPLAHTEENR